MPKTKPTTVDEYIEAAREQAQKKLGEIRALLKNVVPTASETLKWSSPYSKQVRESDARWMY